MDAENWVDQIEDSDPRLAHLNMVPEDAITPNHIAEFMAGSYAMDSRYANRIIFEFAKGNQRIRRLYEGLHEKICRLCGTKPNPIVYEYEIPRDWLREELVKGSGENDESASNNRRTDEAV